MVLINTAQQKKLHELWAAKKEYDEQDRILTQQVAAERNRRKEILRKLVGEAMALEIPKRQIHQSGLGMKQANQMVGFLAAPGAAADALAGLTISAPELSEAALVSVPARNVEPTVDFNGKVVKWTRRDGTKHTGTVQGQAWGVVYTLDNLTDEDKEILDSTDNKRVLFGDAEIEAYEDGTHPAHWAGKNIPVNKYA